MKTRSAQKEVQKALHVKMKKRALEEYRKIWARFSSHTNENEPDKKEVDHIEILLITIPIVYLLMIISLISPSNPKQPDQIERTQNWEEEAAKAIEYSKRILLIQKPEVVTETPIHVPQILAPVPVTREVLYPAYTELKTYLRDVCYRGKDFFEDEHYFLTLQQEDVCDVLVLHDKTNPVLSAFLEKGEITHIDYGKYGKNDHYLVRQYFKKALEELNIEEWKETQRKTLHFAPVKEIICKKKEKTAALERIVLQAYDQIQLLLDELEEKEVELSLEWQHKTAHHFREPIFQMMAQYNGLSYGEKERIHEAFITLLGETKNVLKEQTKRQDRKKTEALMRDMDLLKTRIRGI